MAKRRGNPNWGKPDLSVAVNTPCTFDTFVASLNLSREQYAGSKDLKAWVLKNKDSKYIPLDVLDLWGFEPKTDD